MQQHATHGVIAWQGRMLVYWLEQDQWHARHLGEQPQLDVDAALRAAIEADRAHQARKAAARD